MPERTGAGAGNITEPEPEEGGAEPHTPGTPGHVSVAIMSLLSHPDTQTRHIISLTAALNLSLDTSPS